MITLPKVGETDRLISVGIPMIAWDGEASDDAEDALAVNRDPEAKKLAKAKRFLQDHFKNHPLAQPCAPIIKAASKQGISYGTLFRARQDLDIRAYQQASIWFWEPNA